MKLQFQFAVLLSVGTFVLSLPFVYKSKIALSDMRGGIRKLKNKLDTMDQKIKTLDSDLSFLGKAFTDRKGYKYKGHCYYYSEDLADWFTAEDSCRKLGGYIVKFDEKAESDHISSNRPQKSDHYWIGLTDLKEGEYRWSYDQTKATFLPWEKGWGARGTNNNCVMFRKDLAEWVDYPCGRKFRYICESDYCY